MGNILVFCAHSDDEAIGIAGTIAKHIKEKDEVTKIVFSHGELSLPHLQEKHVKKTRVLETNTASHILKIRQTIFLGFKDLKLKKEVDNPRLEKMIINLIKKYKPTKIYCPTSSDPHPDHQAVNTVILKVVDSLKKKYLVYGYEVWNVTTENHPAIYIDITPFIKKKLAYIKSFKSQWVYMFSLYFPAIARAKQYGLKNHCKYAEKIYKLR